MIGASSARPRNQQRGFTRAVSLCASLPMCVRRDGSRYQCQWPFLSEEGRRYQAPYFRLARRPALSMSMKATTFRDRCLDVGYSA